jgi:formylglycine-generating enzyme required for sulfatase activity
MDDAPKADALPLLAFALQRLWRQYSASKSLTAKNYQKIGGLKGLIEDAAERALRGLAPNQDTPLPNGPPPKQIVDLAASTFVPELVELNEQGGLVRHIAKWHDFSYEQRDLLTRFDQWRLMVRREAIDGDTVEVAHEALFREWSRLRGWLEPERARLDAIRTLQTDALTWDRNGRDAAFLNHRKNRLIQVVRLAENEAYRKRLTSLDFDYLSGCKHAERSSKNKVRLVKTLVATLAIVIAIGIAAWRNQEWLKERIYQVTDVTVWTATEEQALKLGDKFRECSGCPEMIVVPKGNFKMGSPTNQGDRSGREYPLHPVSMSTRFAVGKFPIVFDEWKTCVEHGDCDAHIDSKDWGKGQQPVINVTWEDARRYVEWLARITGKPYRLLSEAEYEYAARAGTESPYPWGPNAGSQYANCGECGTQWAGVQPAPAGSFLPNRFGLFDMVGNVAEMVEDCFHDNYENAPKDGSPWLSDRCVRHVTRGGDWLSRLDRIRSASRDWIGIDERKDTVGFRVARTLSP